MKTVKLLLALFILSFVATEVKAYSSTELLEMKSDFAQDFYYQLRDDMNLNMGFGNETLGGVYLDNVYDLHILVKGSSEVIRSLEKRYGIYQFFNGVKLNVFFKQATYSQTEIRNAYQIVVDSELFQKGIINDIWIDYQINGFRIGFSTLRVTESDLTVTLNKLLGDFDNFILEEYEDVKAPEPKYNIYGGEQLHTSASGLCSLGFAAMRFDNKIGFVTAGHCYALNSTISYFNPVTIALDEIGVVISRKLLSNVDAEFIQLFGGFSTPNTAKWQNSYENYETYIKSISERPVQGSSIRIYGYQGMYTTTITSNDASTFTFGNPSTWNHMLRFPEVTQNGDSGGVIISGGKAVGIVRGGGWGVDYATPADTIVTYLGLNY